MNSHPIIVDNSQNAQKYEMLNNNLNFPLQQNANVADLVNKARNKIINPKSVKEDGNVLKQSISTQKKKLNAEKSKLDNIKMEKQIMIDRRSVLNSNQPKRDTLVYDDEQEKSDSYFQTPKSFNFDQDNSIIQNLNSDIQTPSKIQNEDYSKQEKLDIQSRKIQQQLTYQDESKIDIILQDKPNNSFQNNSHLQYTSNSTQNFNNINNQISENLEETSLIPLRQIIQQAKNVRNNFELINSQPYYSFSLKNEPFKSSNSANYQSSNSQNNFFTLGQNAQQLNHHQNINSNIIQPATSRKLIISQIQPRKEINDYTQTQEILFESQIIDSNMKHEEAKEKSRFDHDMIQSGVQQFQNFGQIYESYPSINNKSNKIGPDYDYNQLLDQLNNDYDESVVIDDAEEFRSQTQNDRKPVQTLDQESQIINQTQFPQQNQSSMVVQLFPILITDQKNSENKKSHMDNTHPSRSEEGQEHQSLESFIIKENDLNEVNHSYQLALGMQVLTQNLITDQDISRNTSVVQSYSEQLTSQNQLQQIYNENSEQKENMIYQTQEAEEEVKVAQSLVNQQVYDRLYIHAKDLRFKQEFEKYVDDFMVKKSMGQRFPYQSLKGDNSKSIYKSVSRQNIYDDNQQEVQRSHSMKQLNQVQKLRPTSHRESLQKLYQDHQVRQDKNTKQIEDLEKQIQQDMTKQKSNKNSHNLALQKLEKELFQILKYVSKKVFHNDEQWSHTQSEQNYLQSELTPQQLEDRMRKSYQEQLKKKELFLSKRQLQEFFVVTGIFKYINEEQPENLQNKQLDKMNQEIEFLEKIWAVVNIKYDPLNQIQSFTIELEFILQLFKIIFDPYSQIDQQAQLVIELRKIIKSILQNNQFQTKDVLAPYFESEILLAQYLRETIEEFRDLNSNFYNISHLASLSYFQGKRSISPSKSPRRDDRKYAKLQDVQQCSFQPKINQKSKRIDPISKGKFVQQMIMNQLSQRCNSEVIDEDEQHSPFSRHDSKKIINILNASNTQISRQSQSFIGQNSNQQSSLSYKQQTQPKINQSQASTIQDNDYKNKLVQVFSIQHYGNNRVSPSRQQLLALGFQGSTDDSRKTYYDEITDTKINQQQIHTRNSEAIQNQNLNNYSINSYNSNPRSQERLNRNIILYEQGKMQRDYQQKHFESLRKVEENKFSYHPDINKKSQKIMQSNVFEQDSNKIGTAHERLHNIGIRKEIQKDELLEKERRELSEKRKKQCTFRPQITNQINYDNEKVQRIQTKGFDQMVKRMKDGQVLKAKKLSDFINLGQVKNYTGKPTVSEPFDFKTQKREIEKKQKKKPFIIIEIIISPGKAAHLPIYEGDNPNQLCNSFSRTYNLSKQAKDSLLHILQSHLETSDSVGATSYSTARNEVDREYGVNEIRLSPSRQTTKMQYELEYSKIVEVSETNESDGFSKIIDKENRI